MSSDYTELQSGDDERQARDLSLRHTRPPTQVPGYDLTRFLGAGAYGEVWVGLDRNTGRQIAVKFYQHRGGVDWSLLSREVEKLVLLSADRYVVQLLDVGWQADPPYYVMEFIENGSLEQLIARHDSQSVDEVVTMFREIATGLNRAHSKGILHCDLKPANVLLDQDQNPRLADFGQSRLTDEQTPSLGTLFYMAPEQADLKAVPDARWDVYALGAILYCLLVGKPPHHNQELLQQIEEAPDLTGRLSRYRKWIASRKVPDEHRKVPGVDRALAGIVDRCLQPRPSRRFPNVQSVLNALRNREQVRARRPLLLLGVLGPLLLLMVMWYFGKGFYNSALSTTDQAVTEKVWESNGFAAKFVASSVAAEIGRYYQAVEMTAQQPALLQAIVDVVDQLDDQLIELADSQIQAVEAKLRAKQAFLGNEVRLRLQAEVDSLYQSIIAPLEERSPPEAVSLYVCGPRGNHLAGAFPNGSTATIGDNFAYRSYCHGGLRDLDDRSARPMPQQHVTVTSLSSPLLSVLNQRWKIAVSTPVFRPGDPQRLLGVVVLSVDVGEIVGDHLQVDTGKGDASAAQDLQQFALLVDDRNNGYRGMILDHPMFRDKFQPAQGLPADFSQFRVPLFAGSDKVRVVSDPFGQVEGGEAYAGEWISASAPVVMQQKSETKTGHSPNTGLIVFVQENKKYATTPVRALGQTLVGKGIRALLGFLTVVGLLWLFVLRVQGSRHWWRRTPFNGASSLATPTPAQTSNSSPHKTPQQIT